ncbi:Kinase suppressor of Ras 2 [Babesia caballi]|uniref:Kinase suppressor of Ras 2 n=1 Tax=Babesia caballi TaxID=5871 RepID=A0AAV4LNX5_BABCB|nr:Kinase suppressor of Ras 2 [Babesia caballi]
MLVVQILNLQRLDHIRLEQRTAEGLLDLHHQKLAQSAVELRGDDLRLVADGEPGHRTLSLSVVGRKDASQHLDEGGFASPVLTQHHQNLRVAKVASTYREFKAPELLLHLGVLVIVETLNVLQLHVGGQLEAQRVLAEPQVLSGHKPVQKYVDALTHAEGRRDDAVHRRFAPEAANVVRHVVEHGQVVLHDDDVSVVLHGFPNDTRGDDALANVQVTAGLVEHGDMAVREHGHANGEALQLPPGQLRYLAVQQVRQLKRDDQVLGLAELVLGLQYLTDSALNLGGLDEMAV